MIPLRLTATVSSAVKTLAADFSAASGDDTIKVYQRATITARSAGVMISWDGTNPTATVGHLVPQNGSWELTGRANLRNLRFLREAGSDAVVTVTLEVN